MNSFGFIRPFFSKLIFRMFFVSKSFEQHSFPIYHSPPVALKQSISSSESISKEKISSFLELIHDITPGRSLQEDYRWSKEFSLEIESMIEQRDFFQRYCDDEETPMFVFLINENWLMISLLLSQTNEFQTIRRWSSRRWRCAKSRIENSLLLHPLLQINQQLNVQCIQSNLLNIKTKISMWFTSEKKLFLFDIFFSLYAKFVLFVSKNVLNE